jgi:hypothetical protein
MFCLFLCIAVFIRFVVGLTFSNDFVNSHVISNPLDFTNSTFGYGLVISDDGLDLYTVDYSNKKMYYYSRNHTSLEFEFVYQSTIPVYGNSYPIVGSNNVENLVYSTNDTVVFIDTIFGSIQQFRLSNENVPSVSISNDGLWVVVGRTRRNELEVYRKVNSLWSLYQGGIRTSINQVGGFGTSVAMNGDGSIIASVFSVTTLDSRVWLFKRNSLGSYTEFQILTYPDATDTRHGRNEGFQVPIIDISNDSMYIVWGAPYESNTGIILVWKQDPSTGLYSLYQILDPVNTNPISTDMLSSNSVQISSDGEVICANAFESLVIYGKSFLNVFTTGNLFDSQEIQDLPNKNPVVSCSGNTVGILDNGVIRVRSLRSTMAPTKVTSLANRDNNNLVFLTIIIIIMNL